MNTMYREHILDHYKNPRNVGKLVDATSVSVDNPLCGDSLTLHVQFNNCEQVEDVRFEGSGCAVSVASASLMTEYLKGKTHAQLLTIDEHTIRELLHTEINQGREKCAYLVLEALKKVLQEIKK